MMMMWPEILSDLQMRMVEESTKRDGSGAVAPAPVAEVRRRHIHVQSAALQRVGQCAGEDHVARCAVGL